MECQTEIKGDTETEVEKPVFKYKIGAFGTAVFLHDLNGRSVPSVVLEKSYTKDGINWNHKKMALLSTTEIDKLICVLHETKKALYVEGN